jgi:hypothetical protein
MLERYKGIYRIACEFDRVNLEPIKEDTYIVCAGSGQIYRVDNNLLAYYKPKRGNSEQFVKKLIDKGVKSVNNCSSDGDVLIYFSEDSLDIVAEEVGASKNGADISPSSIRNLRKLKWFKDNIQYYIDNGHYKEKEELTEEEKEVYRQRFVNNLNKSV